MSTIIEQKGSSGVPNSFDAESIRDETLSRGLIRGVTELCDELTVLSDKLQLLSAAHELECCPWHEKTSCVSTVFGSCS